MALGIGAELGGGVAHGGEIDDGGNAGEVLHQHAGRAEGDLDLGLALVLEPAGEGLDVGLGDGLAVLEAQQVLQQHLQRDGQAGDVAQSVLRCRLKAVIGVRLGARP